MTAFGDVLDALPRGLHRRAFPVIGKRPLIRGWQYARGPQALNRIRDKFQYDNRVTGAGLYMGRDQTGALAVLDVDAFEGLPSRVLDELAKWPWHVKTPRAGGGGHFYGIPPSGDRYARTLHGPGEGFAWGQYKARGGLVVAPGSLHSSGALYLPSDGFGSGDPPDFPRWLLDAAFSTPLTLFNGVSLARPPQSKTKRPQHPPPSDGAVHEDAHPQRAEDGPPPRPRAARMRPTDSEKKRGSATAAEAESPPKRLWSQTRPKRGTGSLNTSTNIERMLTHVGARGRNTAMFEALRTYALVAELPSTFDDYLADVLNQARTYHALLPDVRSNGGFSIDEALRVARKVAPWTWWFRHKQAGRGRRSGKVRREAVADRDGRILAAHTQGASMRTIAAAEGLSPGTVHHVVHRTPQAQLELAPPIDLSGWKGRSNDRRPDTAARSYPDQADEKGSDGPTSRPAAYGRGALYPNPPPRNPGVQ